MKYRLFLVMLTAISFLIGIAFNWNLTCCILSIGISVLLLVDIIFEVVHILKGAGK